MDPSEIPYPGIFTPACLAYNPNIPAHVLQTWVQLRGLVLEGRRTPPIHITDLVRVTGKSHSSLHRHMALLKALGVIEWTFVQPGTLIVSFAPEPRESAFSPASGSQAACQEERPPTANSSRLAAVQCDSQPGTTATQKSKIEPQNRKNDRRTQALSPPSDLTLKTQSHQPERIKREGKKSQPSHPVIECFRRQTGMLPHRSVRELIVNQVTDLDLWEITLEHWISHGWNPKNVTGQLDLYRRGGPGACRFCQEENHPPKHTLDVLDQLRKELTNG